MEQKILSEQTKNN